MKEQIDNDQVDRSKYEIHKVNYKIVYIKKQLNVIFYNFGNLGFIQLYKLYSSGGGGCLSFEEKRITSSWENILHVGS